mmetsp:Transcript_36467/g.65655  ORF Transcript_36467/g.65655 Transcript_36467/m.65655 type:complete len:98 (-) Transcript_36467:1945-2238(-)
MHGSSQAKTSPNVKLCVLIPSFRKDASGFREVEDESPIFRRKLVFSMQAASSTLPFLLMSRPGPTSTEFQSLIHSAILVPAKQSTTTTSASILKRSR